MKLLKGLLKLNNKQAAIFAAIAFVFTMAMFYILPGYTITLSGLLVVIFLSVFVENIRSTLIAAGVSVAVHSRQPNASLK